MIFSIRDSSFATNSCHLAQIALGTRLLPLCRRLTSVTADVTLFIVQIKKKCTADFFCHLEES